MVVILGCLLSNLSWAYESEPQELVFHDEFDVFAGLEYTTGWLPAGSPVATQFYIASEGGAFTDMAAVSTLTWPETLTHTITGVPGSGRFSLLTDLDVVAEVQVDVFGYNGTWEVWSTGLEMSDSVAFDPTLLAGSEPDSLTLSSEGVGLEPADVELGLFPGVSLQFTAELFPRSEASLYGLRIETNDTVMDTEGQSFFLEVPEGDPGQLDLVSTYVAWIDASLNLVIQPTMSFCVEIIGCYDVASFDIPITLADVSEEHAFEPVSYTHPLPAIELHNLTHDFGNVRLGELVTLELPIENTGLLDLEGTLSVEGSDALSVFPSNIYAAPGGADGVVVMFAPTQEGEMSALVVVETNDPRRPRIEIPVGGLGLLPGVEPGGDTEPIKTCGCALAPTSLAVWPTLLGLGLVVSARRRRR